MVVAESLPAPVVERHGDFFIVRDDLITGGTKVRALSQLLTSGDEFAYAAPAAGYAQVALAVAAARCRAKATIFVAQRKTLHPHTQEAQRSGARIIQVPVGYMSVVRARARDYCSANGAQLLPFGFDTPAFVDILVSVAQGLNLDPVEVWSVAGSGVLTRALQRAWSRAAVYAVRIGAKPKVGRAIIYEAPERFEQVAKYPPPFPSCSNYDGKAWQFIKAHAKPGALFWNVAA